MIYCEQELVKNNFFFFKLPGGNRIVIPLLKTSHDEKIECSSESGVFRNLFISSK